MPSHSSLIPATPHEAPPPARRAPWQFALFCVAVYLVCLTIAWPFAEMGIDDDWSYIRTAQVLAQTGHLTYNGWAAPMLGWQAAWGALFIHVFGFSFTAARFSMLPVSIGCIVLFYLVLARFGIHARNAVIGTLTLALSPLFLPLSVSFMTDVPGLFAILACLYLCRRAIDAVSDRATILWLVSAAAISTLGGTARQTAWLGALVMAPACGWLLRKRRGVLSAAFVSWLCSLAVVLLCLAWLYRQPYWIANDLQEQVPLGWLMHAILTFYVIGGGVLSLLIVVLPVLGVWLPQMRTAGRNAKLLYAVFIFVAALMQLAAMRPLPWVLHTIQLQLSPHRLATLRPVVLDTSVPELILAFVVVIFLAASVLACAAVLLRPRRDRSTCGPVCPELFWLCAPLCAAYAVLLLPRAIHAIIFDRYMIMLAPVAILCLVCLYQQWVAPRLPAASVVLLAAMAALSVAGTHDWFAWQRARLAAIAELTTAGIPRTSFYGGIEYDGWTQIEAGGAINNPFLTNPPGAYKPQPPVSKEDPCGYGFAPYVPSIRAQYTVVFEPQPCFQPTQFRPVTYTSWIPPFRRTIYVQRIPAAEQKNGQH